MKAEAQKDLLTSLGLGMPIGYVDGASNYVATCLLCSPAAQRSLGRMRSPRPRKSKIASLLISCSVTRAKQEVGTTGDSARARNDLQQAAKHTGYRTHRTPQPSSAGMEGLLRKMALWSRHAEDQLVRGKPGAEAPTATRPATQASPQMNHTGGPSQATLTGPTLRNSTTKTDDESRMRAKQ